MGPRLLCFAGGAALTAFYVHLGLLATPFFGSGAFLWANVFASFLLALALGYGLGDLLAHVAGPKELEKAAPRLAVAGGIGAWLAAWALPVVAREVLEHDPDWNLAAAVVIVAVSLLPGACLAGIVPSELRSQLDDCDGRTGARLSMRLLGLMTLGGVAGIVLTAKPILRADEVDVWLHAYGTSAGLVLLGMAFLGKVGRLVGISLVLGMAGLSVARPSEIQTEQFAVALETAWKEGQGASLYFRRTNFDASDQELRKLAESESLEKGEKPGLILTLEMLQRLGEVTVTGEGLRGTLELLLDPAGRPFVMPFFEPLESIRSDGKGMLYATLERKRGVQGRRFQVPGKAPGDQVEFHYKDDFTIHLIHEVRGNVWRLEFGPVETEHAGLLEVNDTKRTPLRVINVVGWIDASLLGIIIEDHPDQLVLRAVAQGEIGDVKTVDVMAVAKEK